MSLILNLDLELLISKLLSLCIVLSIFTGIFCTLDHRNFSGITEEEDKNHKAFNRFYFVITTASSTGYGDISPKSITARILSILLQISTTIGIISTFLQININKKIVDKS